MKSPPSRGFTAPHVHPRLRRRISRCTLDCGFKTSESPALRGFAAERAPIRGTSLYLVLKSNGLRHPKNLPVKFGFSPKTVSTNAAQKLPPQCCSKPLFIAFFSLSHKWPTFAFAAKAGTHSAFGERSHTRAYTTKHRPSLPRPQRGFALPVKSLCYTTRFHRAFIYIHFPVLCEPHYQQREKSGEIAAINFIPQPFLIAFFNISHKRPTFAFTSESGYTRHPSPEPHTQQLTRRNTGRFGWGWYHYPRTVPHVHKHPRAGYQNGILCRFGDLVGGALKERREPRDSDALMRVAVPRRRGPAGLRDLFAFVEMVDLYIRRSWFSACARRGVVSPLLVCSACC